MVEVWSVPPRKRAGPTPPTPTAVTTRFYPATAPTRARSIDPQPRHHHQRPSPNQHQRPTTRRPIDPRGRRANPTAMPRSQLGRAFNTWRSRHVQNILHPLVPLPTPPSKLQPNSNSNPLPAPPYPKSSNTTIKGVKQSTKCSLHVTQAPFWARGGVRGAWLSSCSCATPRQGTAASADWLIRRISSSPLARMGRSAPTVPNRCPPAAAPAPSPKQSPT